MADYRNGVEVLDSPVVMSPTITGGSISGITIDANTGTFTVKYKTTTQRTAMIPALGEPVLDTDEKKLYIGDAVTLGGILVGPSS